MLYHLLFPLADQFQIFNLFRYISFRSGGALLTSLLISFIFGPSIISYLRRKQKEGQPIRLDGPESHLLTKQGIPTMGGMMIIMSVAISTLLWADLRNSYIWIVLYVTMGFGTLGFLDDYLKITKRNHKGVSGKVKLVVQTMIGVIACLWIQSVADHATISHLAIPFLKNTFINLSWLYIVFVVIVIIGSSNAVNLTDGLDGLAIVPIMISVASFGLISYLVGNSIFSNYLQIHHVVGSGELTIFCATLVGAGLGFLWFNAPPAQIFMGDTGSLAFGGAIGTISVITKHELILSVIGGLFVMEALSVIIQVYYFKLSGGKLIFRMAPLHHHFEKKGWSEATVVIRFWIISVIFALIGLASLKLR